jgi:hypothetical protein
MGHEREDRRKRRAGTEQAGDEERAPAAAGILALQQAAGNRAVSALLAREVSATELAEKAKDAGAQGARVEIAGIGTIPIESVNLGGGGNRASNDIVFASRSGEHTPKLMKAMTEATPLEIEIVLPRGTAVVRAKLKGAIITSFQTASGNLESWSVNVQSIEWVHQGGEGEESDPWYRDYPG